MAHHKRGNGTQLGGGDQPTAQEPPSLPEPAPEGIDGFNVISSLMASASQAAKAQAKAHPNEEGYPIIGIVFDHDGNLILEKNGLPIVMTLPNWMMGRDQDGNVQMKLSDVPDRFVSPKEAARQLDTSISSLKRARTDGHIPEPTKISTRRTAWRQSEVMRIISKGGIEGMREQSKVHASGKSKRK